MVKGVQTGALPIYDVDGHREEGSGKAVNRAIVERADEQDQPELLPG